MALALSLVAAQAATGCGFVTDDPAGSAASAGGAIPTITVTTLATTTSVFAPLVPGAGEPAPGSSGGPAPAPGPVTGPGTATGVVPGPAADLTEEDRRALRLCVAVVRLQEAGVAAVEASIGDGAGLGDRIAEVVAVLDSMSADAPGPVAARIRVVADGFRGVAGAGVEALNVALEARAVDITAVLTALSTTCPDQLPLETVGQAELIELGAPPRPGVLDLVPAPGR